MCLENAQFEREILLFLDRESYCFLLAAKFLVGIFDKLINVKTEYWKVHFLWYLFKTGKISQFLQREI